MYTNDCKKVDETACVVPNETMKDTLGNLHDQTTKAKYMAEDIYDMLFGVKMPKDDEKAEVFCAYDLIKDTQSKMNMVLETLYAIIQRIES